MTTLREAAQQALEALHVVLKDDYRLPYEKIVAATDALNVALAEPVQEPVHKCKKCSAYFERFSYGMKTIKECDCPKCQGYCECKYGIIS